MKLSIEMFRPTTRSYTNVPFRICVTPDWVTNSEWGIHKSIIEDASFFDTKESIINWLNLNGVCENFVKIDILDTFDYDSWFTKNPEYTFRMTSAFVYNDTNYLYRIFKQDDENTIIGVYTGYLWYNKFNGIFFKRGGVDNCSPLFTIDKKFVVMPGHTDVIPKSVGELLSPVIISSPETAYRKNEYARFKV